MTLASALSALCDMLRTQTGAQVTLGSPDDGVPGVYVWPWRLEEDTHLRNTPAQGPGARTSPSIYFLVFTRPALTADGLSTLDKARQAILDHPVLDLEGMNIRVSLSPLGVNDLTALFAASSIPLTVCLSGQLREAP